MTNYIVWVTVPVCVVFVSLICVQNVHRHAAADSAWSKMQMAIDKVACSQKIRKHKGHCHEKEKQWRAANATHAREYRELDKMYQDALDNIAKHEQDSAAKTMQIDHLEHKLREKSDKLDACHDEVRDCQKASDDCQKAADDCQDKHDDCQGKHDECQDKHDDCQKAHDDCQKAHDDCQKASDDCHDTLTTALGVETCYFIVEYEVLTRREAGTKKYFSTDECEVSPAFTKSIAWRCSIDGQLATKEEWDITNGGVNGCSSGTTGTVTSPSSDQASFTCRKRCI